ncbi:hypothetical protein [Rhodococcoides fascians]|uniref:hypothetical protein n=1 Tax=Rhodococcoides fascians TaxID=1828 RepID=UPI00056C7871|nr:hypothetical protein [Rhodococcus fascians]
MARLTHPDLGTIIECDGAVEALFRAQGWADSSDAPVSDESPAPRKRTRTRKTTTAPNED